MTKNESFIYHIIRLKDWLKSSKDDFYQPDSFEVDKFIHFSKENQVKGVFQRYYKDAMNPYVLKVDVHRLIHELRYEESTSNEKYPHLYGKLNLNSVVAVYPLLTDDNSGAYWVER